MMTASGRSGTCPVLPPIGILTRVRAILRRWPMVAGACLSAAACAGPQPAGDAGALPARIVLHYDFAGDWAATAGDLCEDRPDISRAVFVSIAAAPGRESPAFHVARFYMLDNAAPAEALVGAADGTGNLSLAVETESVVDGRDAEVRYDLTFVPEDPRHIRLTSFRMTMRDRAGDTVRAELLARAAADPTIPVLSEAGDSGLCLKRL
jgi:hypothetical protein